MTLETKKTAFIALVDGQMITEIPNDLFIPPDALEVLLDAFSGPLDLLLYLIRKQNIDIMNIPMVRITEQYLQYIELMQCKKIELAADYLLMAATLAEIKSKCLLPVVASEEEEEDPRMALVRKLQAYEQIKLAATSLDSLPRQDREHFIAHVMPGEVEVINMHPEVALTELAEAFQSLMIKEGHSMHHRISREALSVKNRMNEVLLKLQECAVIEFTRLFSFEEGRMGLVVSLLAILELARQSLLLITQAEPFAMIYIKAV